MGGGSRSTFHQGMGTRRVAIRFIPSEWYFSFFQSFFYG